MAKSSFIDRVRAELEVGSPLAGPRPFRIRYDRTLPAWEVYRVAPNGRVAPHPVALKRSLDAAVNFAVASARKRQERLFSLRTVN